MNLSSSRANSVGLGNKFFKSVLTDNGSSHKMNIQRLSVNSTPADKMLNQSEMAPKIQSPTGND